VNAPPVTRRRLWSPARVSCALALAAWAAMFWFILVTGLPALSEILADNGNEVRCDKGMHAATGELARICWWC